MTAIATSIVHRPRARYGRQLFFTHRTILQAVFGLFILISTPMLQAQTWDNKSTDTSETLVPNVQLILAELAEKGNLEAANLALDKLALQVGVHTDFKEDAAFAELGYAKRLLNLLSKSPGNRLKDDVLFLLENRALAEQLAILSQYPDKITGNELPLLRQLKDAQPKAVEDIPQLAAAIAMTHVHSRPFRVNGQSIDPFSSEKTLEYFAKFNNRLVYPPSKMPAELLVHVVNINATEEDISWALKTHGRRADIDRRYHEVPIDFNHLENGVQMAILTAGYSLRNLQRHGGMMEDQAYYAYTVGKVLGIPTIHMTSRANDSGHAWVGFVAAQRGNFAWNMVSAKHQDYITMKGQTRHPLTGEVDRMENISITAFTGKLDLIQRFKSLGILYCTQVMMTHADSLADVEPIVKARGRAKTRKATPQGLLEMVTEATDVNPGNIQAWFFPPKMAQLSPLDEDMIEDWIKHTLNILGPANPDMAVDVLYPVLQTVEDYKERSKYWDQLGKAFSRNKMLMADIRMLQGIMWEEAGNLKNAGRAYSEVFTRYPEGGDAVTYSLERTEMILNQNNAGAKMLPLYERTWRRAFKPRSMLAGYQSASNYVKVGRMFATSLQSNMQESRAQTVTDELSDFTNKVR